MKRSLIKKKFYFSSVVLSILFLAVLSSSSFAKEEYVMAFMSIYSKSRAVQKYGCKICHIDKTDLLNDYGDDLKNLILKKNNTLISAFRGTAGLDSDDDGYMNLQEILLNKNPGDKSDFPEEAVYEGMFQYAEPLHEPRELHALTLLNDGRVLVSGGLSIGFKVLSACELFDPSKNFFSKVGSMKYGRCLHTSTLLKNGKVLIAGGVGGRENEKKLVKEAELFDPKTGKFSSAGYLNIAREGHTATLLPDGRVLIAGGGASPAYFTADTVSECEIYDPGKKKFEVAGKLKVPRQFHTATLLNKGEVLIAGGSKKGLNNPLSDVEIFNPEIAESSLIPSLNDKRVGHSTVRFRDGRVFIAGGSDFHSVPRIRSAEIFDQQSKKFQYAGLMHVPRVDIHAVLLDDGNVLVAGGSMKGPVFHKSAEVYDAEKHEFFLTGAMSVARDTFASAKLTDGRVLFAGGATRVSDDSPFRFLNIAEVFEHKRRSNEKPAISVNTNKNIGKTPFEISLNAKVGKEISVFWDFGDGSTGEGESINHIYICPGDYHITAIAIKESGISSHKYVEVKVLPNDKNSASFNCDIQPILDNRCRTCHGFFDESLLGTYDELIDSSLVVPKNIKESILLKINDLHKSLPGYKPLISEEFSLITRWISEGSKRN